MLRQGRGLALFPLVFLSHGGSLLSKGFATRTLSEFGREPLLLVLNFQLNVGHPLPSNVTCYFAVAFLTQPPVPFRMSLIQWHSSRMGFAGSTALMRNFMKHLLVLPG